MRSSRTLAASVLVLACCAHLSSPIALARDASPAAPGSALAPPHESAAWRDGSSRDALGHPLELAFASWREATAPRPHPELLADLLARLARHDGARERIVLRPEASPETVYELTARTPGPPLVASVLEELPILGQAWAIANDLVPGSSERLRDLTLELGGDTLLPVLPDALRDFGGALARGPYSRDDDSNGGTLTIDVRVVLSWRPRDQVHLEAGYALAYAGGEYGAQLDNQSGRRAEFFRHGPWAAVGLDF